MVGGQGPPANLYLATPFLLWLPSYLANIWVQVLWRLVPRHRFQNRF